MHLNTGAVDCMGLHVVWAERRSQVMAQGQDQGITSSSLGRGRVGVQIQPQQWRDLGKSSNIWSLSVPICKLGMATTYISLGFQPLCQGLMVPSYTTTLLPVTVTLYEVRQDKKEVEEVSYGDRR